MAQQNLDLLTRLAYLQAGGRDPGQIDIDKINSIFGGVSNVGKSLMDYATTKAALDKAELERRKLEQETMPAYRAVGGTSPQETKLNLQGVMKSPIPAEDLISGQLASTQRGIEQEAEKARLGQDIYSKYGPATIGQAKDIETARYIESGTPLRQSQIVKNLREPIQKPNITTPVISGGIATRDFVKILKPELQEGEDMPYGEYLRRAALLQAETTAGQPKPISSEQVDKITQVRTAITGLGDIKDQYFSLLGKGKSPVDPIEGRWTNILGRVGVMSDPEIAKFQTDLVAQLNTYLNALSGAAITEQEAKRLQARLPKIGSTNEQFLGQADSFESELKRALGERVSTLKDAGFRVGDLDRFIIKKQSKAAAPKMKNLPYKSAEEVKKAYQEGKIDKETARNMIKLNFDIGGKQ